MDNAEIRDKYEKLSREQLVDFLTEIHLEVEFANDWDVGHRVAEILGFKIGE